MNDGLLSPCCRRERALSKISSKSNQRAVPAPAVFNRPQSPTSTWSPTASPTSPLPSHVYYTPAMDEPLALIKKPRKEPEREEEKAKIAVPAQIQVHSRVLVAQQLLCKRTICLSLWTWCSPRPATTKSASPICSK